MQKINMITNSIRLGCSYIAEAASYFTRQNKIHSYPIIFQIEPTNHCPMNCVMCPRQYMKREKGYMDFGLFKRIIDQIKVYDNHVQLHHFGDPLMHPQISEFIRYCKEKGVKTNMSVNPILLTKKTSEQIIDSGLDRIYISLDSVDDESYKEIRGIKADYEKAVSNIKYLAELKTKKQKKTPKITVGLIYMKSTKDEVKKFKENWKIKGIDEVCIKPFTGFGMQSILTHADESTLKKIEMGCEYPCFLPWRSITIMWDGRVVPCCYDYDGKYVIGDLKKESLKEIWNNKRMKELREQHIKKRFGENNLCGYCKERYGWPSLKEPAKLIGYVYRKIKRKIRSET